MPLNSENPSIYGRYFRRISIPLLLKKISSNISLAKHKDLTEIPYQAITFRLKRYV